MLGFFSLLFFFLLFYILNGEVFLKFFAFFFFFFDNNKRLKILPRKAIVESFFINILCAIKAKIVRHVTDHTYTYSRYRRSFFGIFFFYYRSRMKRKVYWGCILRFFFFCPWTTFYRTFCSDFQVFPDSISDLSWRITEIMFFDFRCSFIDDKKKQGENARKTAKCTAIMD